MHPFNQDMLNKIHEKCLNYDTNHPVKRSSNVAFRDLFDPYCDEYQSIDDNTRIGILREMLKEGIITSLLVFYKCFMDIFADKRPDIANVAPDALALMLEKVIVSHTDYTKRTPIVPT